jgi:hypothetical protein
MQRLMPPRQVTAPDSVVPHRGPLNLLVLVEEGPHLIGA